MAFLRVLIKFEGDVIAVPAEIQGEAFQNGGNLVLGTTGWPFAGALRVFDIVTQEVRKP